MSTKALVSLRNLDASKLNVSVSNDGHVECLGYFIAKQLSENGLDFYGLATYLLNVTGINPKLVKHYEKSWFEDYLYTVEIKKRKDLSLHEKLFDYHVTVTEYDTVIFSGWLYEFVNFVNDRVAKHYVNRGIVNYVDRSYRSLDVIVCLDETKNEAILNLYRLWKDNPSKKSKILKAIAKVNSVFKDWK